MLISQNTSSNLVLLEHKFQDDVLLFPLGLCSDETLLTNARWGNAANAYPIYVFPLNLKDRDPPPLELLGLIELPSDTMLAGHNDEEKRKIRLAVCHHAMSILVYPLTASFQAENNQGRTIILRLFCCCSLTERTNFVLLLL